MNKYDVISDLASMISELPDDMQGRLFQAAFRYLEKREGPTLKPVEKAIIGGFKWRLDEALEQQEKLSETRRATGKLGGRPRKRETAKNYSKL